MNLHQIYLAVLPILGCIAGFLIREVMAISARRNDERPSLRYYWSLPKNRWMLLTNALCTTAAMMGRDELVTICTDPAFASQWPAAAKFAHLLKLVPFWTSVGIGLFGAFVIRWLITTVDQRFGRSKKQRLQGSPTPQDDAAV